MCNAYLYDWPEDEERDWNTPEDQVIKRQQWEEIFNIPMRNPKILKEHPCAYRNHIQACVDGVYPDEIKKIWKMNS